MNPPINRRRYNRRTSYIVAEYTVKEGTFRDVIKNISAGGIFVWTERNIAVDQSIRLRFPLFHFEETIEVSGTIVRKDIKGFSVAFDAPIDRLIGRHGQVPDIVHEGNRSS